MRRWVVLCWTQRRTPSRTQTTDIPPDAQVDASIKTLPKVRFSYCVIIYKGRLSTCVHMQTAIVDFTRAQLAYMHWRRGVAFHWHMWMRLNGCEPHFGTHVLYTAAVRGTQHMSTYRSASLHHMDKACKAVGPILSMLQSAAIYPSGRAILTQISRTLHLAAACTLGCYGYEREAGVQMDTVCTTEWL